MPRMATQREVGPQVVVLALHQSAASVVGRVPARAVANIGTERRALGGEPSIFFERVGVRIDIENRTETAVRDRAVVALQIILDLDLPVPRRSPLLPLPELESREVQPV